MIKGPTGSVLMKTHFLVHSGHFSLCPHMVEGPDLVIYHKMSRVNPNSS